MSTEESTMEREPEQWIIDVPDADREVQVMAAAHTVISKCMTKDEMERVMRWLTARLADDYWEPPAAPSGEQ